MSKKLLILMLLSSIVPNVVLSNCCGGDIIEENNVSDESCIVNCRRKYEGDELAQRQCEIDKCNDSDQPFGQNNRS